MKNVSCLLQHNCHKATNVLPTFNCHSTDYLIVWNALWCGHVVDVMSGSRLAQAWLVYKSDILVGGRSAVEE